MSNVKLTKERGFQVGGKSGNLVRQSDLVATDVYVVTLATGDQKSFKTRMAALNYMYRIYSNALKRCLETITCHTATQHNGLQKRMADVNRIHRYILEESNKVSCNGK